MFPGQGVINALDKASPSAIHIATEGPLGLAARAYCRKRGFPFTTSFHTLFPEYVHARWRVPVDWSYGVLRRFHAAAVRTMVATPSIEQHLQGRGFRNLTRWSRGVDTQLFRPRAKGFLPYPRPIQLYVGRVAVEKNIDAFLSLPLEGTKVIVGDGPALPALRQTYPETVFVGVKKGEELARHYADADVFVFPSKTDTFGLVMVEALASGVPVAAFPVPGPTDVIGESNAGSLHEDLLTAARNALSISPDVCRAHAERFSWRASVDQFLSNLAVFR